MSHVKTCSMSGLNDYEECDECEIRVSERSGIVNDLMEELVEAENYAELGFVEGLSAAVRTVKKDDF